MISTGRKTQFQSASAFQDSRSATDDACRHWE